jgi:antitoxin component YwqK of YwqJK toxin-antitoxin module
MPKPAEATKDVAHYANGNVKFRGGHLDGEMHGKWEFFRADGSKMRSGAFDRGKQIGVWRTYDRAGKVVKETEFRS